MENSLKLSPSLEGLADDTGGGRVEPLPLPYER